MTASLFSTGSPRWQLNREKTCYSGCKALRNRTTMTKTSYLVSTVCSNSFSWRISSGVKSQRMSIGSVQIMWSRSSAHAWSTSQRTRSSRQQTKMMLKRIKSLLSSWREMNRSRKHSGLTCKKTRRLRSILRSLMMIKWRTWSLS